MFLNKFGRYENVECGLLYCPVGPEESSYYSNKGPTKIPIPLESVNIVASVVHAVAQVELTQVYVNKEENPIEAIYYFPVDSNGGVTHFHAELEGRQIQAIVKPEEEAKAQYEKAVEEKQTSFLVESKKADIFKVRVGYLKPGSQVKIVIGYVTEVKNEKGLNAIRFFIPTTVAPRYTSQTETDEKALDLKKMKFSETSPAPLSITVNVAIQGKIKLIESTTHSIQIERKVPIPTKGNWNRAVVKLTGDSTDMDRDFVLLIIPEEAHIPRLYSEKIENSTALMTHLIPSFNLDEQKVELIFVLDRSGSMQGPSIELAKKALILFLHSLPVDCYFNIIGFGSTFQFLFPESVKYDDGSLKLAITHSQGLRADLGGTEIFQPLEAIFSKELIPNYLRQIFVLTDGEVTNTDRVIGICHANGHNCRVFALGIGHGASHHLVEGLAEAGGGTAAFVTNNEALNSKVLQQLKNAIQPSLTNVSIKWIGLPACPPTPVVVEVEINKEKTLLGYGKPIPTNQPVVQSKSFTQVPDKIQPIFDGSQLIVFGIFLAVVPTGVEIVAESPDGPLSIQIELSDENEVGSNEMIHKLAAIKTIRELEMKESCLSYKFEENNATASEELKKDIVRIACQHGLVSKHTSFVAIDTALGGTSENNWVMQSRYIPSQFAHGWHGGFVQPQCRIRTSSVDSGGNRLHSNIYDGSMNMSFALMTKSCPRLVQQENMCVGQFVGRSLVRKGRSVTLNKDVEDDEDEDEEASPQNDLHALVATQSFNGSFNLTEAFADAIGKTLNILLEESEKNSWNNEAWATALALAYLEDKLSDLKESWELVEVKARKWLLKNFGSELELILNAAKTFFKLS